MFRFLSHHPFLLGLQANNGGKKGKSGNMVGYLLRKKTFFLSGCQISHHGFFRNGGIAVLQCAGRRNKRILGVYFCFPFLSILHRIQFSFTHKIQFPWKAHCWCCTVHYSKKGEKLLLVYRWWISLSYLYCTFCMFVINHPFSFSQWMPQLISLPVFLYV